MKYAWIEAQRDQFSMTRMCRQLEVSRTGASVLGFELKMDVSAGGMPIPLFLQGVSRIAAENETARTVIARTLRGIHYAGAEKLPVPKTSWILIYDVKSKTYRVTFHVVSRDIILGTDVSEENMPRRVVYWDQP